MKNFLIFSIAYCCAFSFIIAQNSSSSFYATMSLSDAKKLEKEYPDHIYIIEKKRNEAAVLLSEEGGYLLHEQILTHGPGYIFCGNREEAIDRLQNLTVQKTSGTYNFSISEDASVLQVMEKIDTRNIANHIQELESYGTRYHTTPNAKKAAEDLKNKWETIANTYNRNDVTVRLVQHEGTPMPSVVLTVAGSEFPDQHIIVGGHLDSTSRHGKENAPGADDGASGIATITEAVRALFEIGFQPKRTIEIMAYAAEEKGLIGSKQIAKSYRKANKEVLAVAQFDMTNYNGSAKDIYFIENDTDDELNSFVMSLIDHYNTGPTHTLTYGSSVCNYGCSDHDSWDNEGYRTIFPFEANIAAGAHNPNIHTASDTFNRIGNADHAAKFAKLCAEFLIEIAKSQTATLAVNEVNKSDYKVFIQNDNITYTVAKNEGSVKMIQVFDVNGRSVYKKTNPGPQGTIPLSGKRSGVYIVSFQLAGDQQFSKKIILE